MGWDDPALDHLRAGGGSALDTYLDDLAERVGLDPFYIDLLKQRETGNLPNPYAAESSAGALGALQVMPQTGAEMAEKYGFDFGTDEGRMEAGARYFKEQLDRFGDPGQAAAAYHSGPGRVQGIIDQGGDLGADLGPVGRDYYSWFNEQVQAREAEAKSQAPRQGIPDIGLVGRAPGTPPALTAPPAHPSAPQPTTIEAPPGPPAPTHAELGAPRDWDKYVEGMPVWARALTGLAEGVEKFGQLPGIRHAHEAIGMPKRAMETGVYGPLGGYDPDQTTLGGHMADPAIEAAWKATEGSPYQGVAAGATGAVIASAVDIASDPVVWAMTFAKKPVRALGRISPALARGAIVGLKGMHRMFQLGMAEGALTEIPRGIVGAVEEPDQPEGWFRLGNGTISGYMVAHPFLKRMGQPKPYQGPVKMSVWDKEAQDFIPLREINPQLADLLDRAPGMKNVRTWENDNVAGIWDFLVERGLKVEDPKTGEVWTLRPPSVEIPEQHVVFGSEARALSSGERGGRLGIDMGHLLLDLWANEKPADRPRALAEMIHELSVHEVTHLILEGGIDHEYPAEVRQKLGALAQQYGLGSKGILSPKVGDLRPNYNEYYAKRRAILEAEGIDPGSRGETYAQIYRAVEGAIGHGDIAAILAKMTGHKDPQGFIEQYKANPEQAVKGLDLREFQRTVENLEREIGEMRRIFPEDYLTEVEKGLRYSTDELRARTGGIPAPPSAGPRAEAAGAPPLPPGADRPQLPKALQKPPRQLPLPMEAAGEGKKKKEKGRYPQEPEIEYLSGVRAGDVEVPKAEGLDALMGQEPSRRQAETGKGAPPKIMHPEERGLRFELQRKEREYRETMERYEEAVKKADQLRAELGEGTVEREIREIVDRLQMEKLQAWQAKKGMKAEGEKPVWQERRDAAREKRMGQSQRTAFMMGPPREGSLYERDLAQDIIPRLQKLVEIARGRNPLELELAEYTLKEARKELAALRGAKLPMAKAAEHFYAEGEKIKGPKVKTSARAFEKLEKYGVKEPTSVKGQKARLDKIAKSTRAKDTRKRLRTQEGLKPEKRTPLAPPPVEAVKIPFEDAYAIALKYLGGERKDLSKQERTNLRRSLEQSELTEKAIRKIVEAMLGRKLPAPKKKKAPAGPPKRQTRDAEMLEATKAAIAAKKARGEDASMLEEWVKRQEAKTMRAEGEESEIRKAEDAFYAAIDAKKPKEEIQRLRARIRELEDAAEGLPKVREWGIRQGNIGLVAMIPSKGEMKGKVLYKSGDGYVLEADRADSFVGPDKVAQRSQKGNPNEFVAVWDPKGIEKLKSSLTGITPPPKPKAAATTGKKVLSMKAEGEGRVTKEELERQQIKARWRVAKESEAFVEQMIDKGMTAREARDAAEKLTAPTLNFINRMPELLEALDKMPGGKKMLKAEGEFEGPPDRAETPAELIARAERNLKRKLAQRNVAAVRRAAKREQARKTKELEEEQEFLKARAREEYAGKIPEPPKRAIPLEESTEILGDLPPVGGAEFESSKMKQAARRAIQRVSKEREAELDAEKAAAVKKSNRFQPGQKVEHPEFGPGTVEVQRHSGPVKVRFEDPSVGTKTMLPTTIRLRKPMKAEGEVSLREDLRKKGYFVHSTDSLEKVQGILSEGMRSGHFSSAGGQGAEGPYVLVYDKGTARGTEVSYRPGDYLGRLKGKPRAIVFDAEAFMDQHPISVLEKKMENAAKVVADYEDSTYPNLPMKKSERGFDLIDFDAMPKELLDRYLADRKRKGLQRQFEWASEEYFRVVEDENYKPKTRADRLDDLRAVAEEQGIRVIEARMGANEELVIPRRDALMLAEGEMRAEGARSIAKEIADESSLRRAIHKLSPKELREYTSEYRPEIVRTIRREMRKALKNTDWENVGYEELRQNKAKLPKDVQELMRKAEGIAIQPEEIDRLQGIQKYDPLFEKLGAPRAIITSLDLSGILRQGIVGTARIGIRHPIKLVGMINRSIKALASEKQFAKAMEAVEGSVDYELLKALNVDFARTEEQFGGARYVADVFKKLTGGRGNFVRMSERAYTYYLNRLRYELGKKHLDSLRRIGFELSATKNKKGQMVLSGDVEVYKKMGDWINVATGRGALPRGKDQLSSAIRSADKFLNAVFFSPRLMLARVAMLNPMTYVGAASEMAKAKGGFKATRALMALHGMDLMAYGALVASVMGGLQMLFPDGEVESDMTSSDFGQFRVGRTRVDVTGGLRTYVTAAARMLTGETKTEYGTIKPQSGWRTIGNFFRGKLGPMPSLAVTLAEGQNVIGEPAYGPFKDVLKGDQPITPEVLEEILKVTGGTIAESTLIPMIAADAYNLVRDNEFTPIQLALLLSLSTLGTGVTTREPPPGLTPLTQQAMREAQIEPLSRPYRIQTPFRDALGKKMELKLPYMLRKHLQEHSDKSFYEMLHSIVRTQSFQSLPPAAQRLMIASLLTDARQARSPRAMQKWGSARMFPKVREEMYPKELRRLEPPPAGMPPLKRWSDLRDLPDLIEGR